MLNISWIPLVIFMPRRFKYRVVTKTLSSNEFAEMYHCKVIKALLYDLKRNYYCVTLLTNSLVFSLVTCSNRSSICRWKPLANKFKTDLFKWSNLKSLIFFINIGIDAIRLYLSKNLNAIHHQQKGKFALTSFSYL